MSSLRIKFIDIYFSYIVFSLIGFVLFWETNNSYYVFFPRILYVLSGFLLIFEAPKILNIPQGKIYIAIFLIFLFYYTINGYVINNAWLVYKPLISNIFFNFLIGFALIIKVNELSIKRAKFYIYISLSSILFITLVVLSSTEPYYVTTSKINLYQTLSDYLLRLIILCSCIIYFCSYKNIHQHMILFFIWLIALLITLASGGKKHLIIEFGFLVFIAISFFLHMHISRKKLIILSSPIILIISSFLFLNPLVDLNKINLAGIDFERLVHTIEVSISGRFEIAKLNFFKFMEASYFFGNPFIDIQIGGIYVHSLPLSLLTSFGLFFGIIIFIIIGYNLLFFIKETQRQDFYVIGLLIFFTSIIATYFDWLLLWHFLGMQLGYKYIKRLKV